MSKFRREQFYQSLSDKRVILNLFKHGRKIFQKSLLLRYLPAPSPQLFVLFAVPRFFGKAVQRNYIRRVLRQILYEVLKEMHEGGERPPTGLCLAIIPANHFATLSYSEQKKDIHAALKKLNFKTN